MDLAHLREYAVLVDEGCFTKAARVLRIAQPTLSKHVAALEREFDVALLVRERSGVRPTEAGKVVYGLACSVGVATMRARSNIARIVEADGEGTCAMRNRAVDRDCALRVCRALGRRYGFDERRVNALTAYVQGGSLSHVQDALGISRDEAADVVAEAYRATGARTCADLVEGVYSEME